MKNIRKIMMSAMQSDLLFEKESVAFQEIDKIILRILVFDEAFGAIDKFLYLDLNEKKVRKSSQDYLIAILERAEYKIESAQKADIELCDSYQICTDKIKAFILYINQY